VPPPGGSPGAAGGTGAPVRARIVVTVHPDGTVTAVTHDILGERCLDYVAILEDLLAAETTQSEFTADRHRTQVADVTPVRLEAELGQAGV